MLSDLGNSFTAHAVHPSHEWKFIFFEITETRTFFPATQAGNKVHLRTMISQSDESLCPMHISLLSTSILFIILFIHKREAKKCSIKRFPFPSASQFPIHLASGEN